MYRILKITILILCFNTALAQTDYTVMNNWYFHPDKSINLISNYNLDIAVIDADLNIDSTIAITNNSENNTGIDVFWVHPTQLTNPSSIPSNVALDDQPYSLISSTIIAQGALLGKYGRFFAPRYQQATPASFLDDNYSDSARAVALLTAYNDVKAAFEHYLNNYNNGNKIILAGHSQGAFLLAMLLRDVFDNNPTLREKLLTASLGGQGFYHAEIGTYIGGQFENIPLCTIINQCQCIHTWRSFKESQQLPSLSTTIPIFNPILVDSGLVYRNADLNTDWFVQDSLFYNTTSSPLRYYIAPDANYNLGGGSNFIAFDSLYTARFKRTSNTGISLAVAYTTDSTDQRPNDLLSIENSASFPLLGFHTKDYHIYLWALMAQIDAKINECSSDLNTTNVNELSYNQSLFNIYPNPNYGTFTLETSDAFSSDDQILIINVFGRILKTIKGSTIKQINLDHTGIYFIKSKYGMQKIIVQ